MKTLLPLSASLLAPVTLIQAQTAKLLKDINSTSLPKMTLPNPVRAQTWTGLQTFVRVGNSIVFSGYSPSTGYELWASTAFSSGTTLLKDIRPGSASSSPASLCVTRDGKRAFFAADDGKTGRELWVTDGSTAGTTRLKDLVPGMGSSGGLNYAAVGDKLVFTARTPATGLELFVTDGTTAGTKLLKDIRPRLGNAVHVTLFGSLAARPTRFGTAGFAHFDLKSYFGITGVTKGKSFAHSLPIPSNPSLKGVQLVFQTLSFDSNNLVGTLELSNGLYWAVGN